MLSPQEKLSDLISYILDSVTATGVVSSADYSILQLTSHDCELKSQERQSITHLLQAIQLGEVNVVPHAMAN